MALDELSPFAWGVKSYSPRFFLEVREMKFSAVTLEVTKKCNHHCTFCYNIAPASSSDVSFEQIDYVVQKLHAYGIQRVTVTGGEPYVVREKTEYLISKLLQYEFDVCLNTNLTLIDNSAANFLEQSIGHCNTVYSSIPSVIEENCDNITQRIGSYKNIIRGLELCKSHSISVGLNMSVSQLNIDDLDYVPAFLRAHPVDSFTLFPVIPPIYDRANPTLSNDAKNLLKVADTLCRVYDEFGIIVGSIRPLPLCIVGNDSRFNVIRGSRCTTGKERFAIDLSSGEVEACSQENKKYGNIYTDTIEECYDRMSEWQYDKFLAAVCQNCSLLKDCGGMCLWSDPCGRC